MSHSKTLPQLLRYEHLSSIVPTKSHSTSNLIPQTSNPEQRRSKRRAKQLPDLSLDRCVKYIKSLYTRQRKIKYPIDSNKNNTSRANSSVDLTSFQKDSFNSQSPERNTLRSSLRLHTSTPVNKSVSFQTPQLSDYSPFSLNPQDYCPTYRHFQRSIKRKQRRHTLS